tara:strand:+ start:219 stop:479 length:261 start_codon:yes stop_codon:yes gene_type:complete
MKTFKQFITEVEAKNSIERLHPFKTMKMGGMKDGKFKYPHHLRLFKKVQAGPKKFGKDSKVNPKALERPEIRDQIFTGKANLDKKA